MKATSNIFIPKNTEYDFNDLAFDRNKDLLRLLNKYRNKYRINLRIVKKVFTIMKTQKIEFKEAAQILGYESNT